MSYKDKRRCIKAMLLESDFERFTDICKELNISKVEQVTNLVITFNNNHLKRNVKKHIK